MALWSEHQQTRKGWTGDDSRQGQQQRASFSTHGGHRGGSDPNPRCTARHGHHMAGASSRRAIHRPATSLLGPAQDRGGLSSINIRTYTEGVCGRSWSVQSCPCLERRASKLAAGTWGPRGSYAEDCNEILYKSHQVNRGWGAIESWARRGRGGGRVQCLQLASGEAYGCTREYTQDGGDRVRGSTKGGSG